MMQFHKNKANGALLGNRYQIEKIIGTGGMGQVYHATDTLLGGVSVAIKFLSQSILDEKMRENFANEARVCASLGNNSIHIVRVMDYGVHEDTNPYYVMEFLSGQSLKNLIEVKPLPLSAFISLARQICIGLQAAHNGIPMEGKTYPVIHRDIKPANIFVSPNPSLGELVKILDFGIAKFFSDHTCATQTNSYIGTLAYSSPEQIEGGDLDTRSDIYSLGVMMFEMLTGRLPWELSNPSFGAWYKAHHYVDPRCFSDIDSNLKIPKNIENLVMSCLAKKARDRPAKITEAISILESFGFGNDLRTRNSIKSSSPTIDRPQNSPNIGVKAETVRQSQKINRSPQGYRLSFSPSSLKPSVDVACWESVWPADKPIAQIVFPNYLKTETETVPSLWVMLSRQDIKKYLSSICYNQFLFSMSPHPMILWVTTVYNSEHGFKWMPCYLDLKTDKGQSVTRSLGETGYYPLLFFSLESPNRCIFVRSSRIAAPQCQVLKDWAQNSYSYSSTADPSVSKKILKLEYEKVKPKISNKLESAASVSTKSGLTQSPNGSTEGTSSGIQDNGEVIKWID